MKNCCLPCDLRYDRVRAFPKGRRNAHSTGTVPGERRNCEGVMENCARKCRQKEALSAKPQEFAISEIRREGEQIAKILASWDNPPDAVQTSDYMASGLLAGFAAAGVEVPRDVSVIGFDDRELAGMLNPPLTTLAQPSAEVGKVSAQMLFERKHRELLEADLAETDVYKLYHDPLAYPSQSDYHNLVEALNKAYDGFTMRLKEFYPGISDTELWFCCMTKAGLSSKETCNISTYSFSALSMAKSRLYAKMFNKKGTARELDAFVKVF